MKTGKVIWLALVYAKQDRRSFIDAYRNDTSEKAVRDALKEIKSFEELQTKLFGTTKTELEQALDKMTEKSIAEIFEREA